MLKLHTAYRFYFDGVSKIWILLLTLIEVQLSYSSSIVSDSQRLSLTRNRKEEGVVYGGSFCDTETFHAECSSSDEVILITHARYGRMSLGRCVQISLGYIGCYSDVLRLADSHCSGRRSCSIRVPNAEFESTRPCLKELKTYLDVNYTCVRVATYPARHCTSSFHTDHILVTSSLEGYIASPSVMAEVISSNCQDSGRPWLIMGGIGQKIIITLIDFTIQDLHGINSIKYSPKVDGRKTSGTMTHGVCDQYGTLQDIGKNGTTIICGGERRKTIVMRSQGHSVRVWLDSDQSQVPIRDSRRFLLYYKVIGCPDQTALPPHLWFKRTGDDSALIGCLYHDVTWPIHCQDNNEWSSYPNNCSSERVDYQNNISDNEQTSNTGLFVQEFTIAFCVMIGLICLLLLLSLGIWHHMRSKNTLTTSSFDVNESMALHYRTDPYCVLDKKVPNYPTYDTKMEAYSIGTVLPPVQPYCDLSAYTSQGQIMTHRSQMGMPGQDHYCCEPTKHCRHPMTEYPTEYQSQNSENRENQLDYERFQPGNQIFTETEQLSGDNRIDLVGNYSQGENSIQYPENNSAYESYPTEEQFKQKHIMYLCQGHRNLSGYYNDEVQSEKVGTPGETVRFASTPEDFQQQEIPSRKISSSEKGFSGKKQSSNSSGLGSEEYVWQSPISDPDDNENSKN